jgi:hypothetical protein
MKLIALCFALIFTAHVKANEIKLAIITSNAVTDTTEFYIETNPDGSVQAVHYISTENDGQIKDDVHKRVTEILEDGMNVKVMEGRVIVKLFLEEFNVETGGQVRLNYLVNGATGRRANMYLTLAKSNGIFVLQDEDEAIINRVFISGNWSRLLRRWIGVSSIDPSFEAF